MKNRFLSLVLAVALLITAIPVFATSARAASDFKVSNECVEIIKKWEGFSAKPYWDYRQWTVGYGTRVPDGKLEEYNNNGISQEEATQLLHAMLNDMGKEVNAFIDKFNLTMTQGQFDALMSLTFNCGGNWTREVSILRTAIIEGWKGTDFLFAMGQWSTAGGVTMPALIRRRLAEANMYLNGVYDYAPPANFVYVRFDPNGGECEIKTQGYDMNEAVDIRAVPTYEGYKFEGWYTSATGGEKVEKLDAGVRNYMLYAHWSAGSGSGMPSDTDQTITGTPVNMQRQIATGVLSSFEKPVKGALVVDGYELGDVVTIVEQYTDSSGRKWGKISGNGGWINLEYTCEPMEEEDDGTGIQIKVTATDVNLRRGPGTDYALVGKANTGDKLTITKTETGSGYTWGKSSKGWICLKYTNYDKVVNSNPGVEEKPDDNTGNDNNTGTTTVKKGTVKVSDGLRIRSGAGTGNPVLGYLSNGARVEILEEKTVDGMLWGRISNGWISMDYVKLDSNDSTTTPEQKPEEETPSAPEKVTGRVTLSSGRLNVRSGPSTGYGVVTSLTNGTEVEILEQKTVGATVWGRISKGWISLDYVKLDEKQEEKPADKPVVTPPETTEPTEPETPTVPETPTEPEEPSEPTEPSQPEQPDDTKPAEKLTGKVVLTSGMLRVRSGAGVSYSIVTNLANGTKVEILETKTVGSTKWGRISNGWISMDYVKLDSQDDTQVTQKINGTVSAGGDSLRIRTAPSTSSAIAGYLADGTKVQILETKTVGSTKWGRISNGWISLDYVKLDGQEENSGSTGNTGATESKTGKVIADCLRIRSGAGTSNKIVGLLYTGEKVTILEEKTVDGVVWGRISKGWISLDYIKF